MKKRSFFHSGLIALAALLAACSSNPEQSALLKSVLLPAADIPKPDPIFLAVAEAGAPAYVVSVERREKAYSSFVLQTRNAQGEESWVSGDGLSVAMKDGLILSTRGFGGDLMSTDTTRLSAMLRSGQTGITELFTTHLDGNDQTVHGAFRCRVQPEGTRPVDLGNGEQPTDYITATCRNGITQFTNLYWMDRNTGQIIQSRQWISDEVGTLALRALPGGS